MRSSLILGVALLLTIAHIVRAGRLGCNACGGSLGSGTNPCTCDDVVVKAADVQKPLYYATPEAITEAATAREVAHLMSSRFPGSVLSYPQQSQTNGLYSVSGGVSHSSSSASSSSTSSSSSVDLFGGSAGGGFSTFNPFSRKPTTSSSSCGCGSKSKVSLELNDLLSSDIQGEVAPRFQPIGDLCDPTKSQISYEVSTKVTPAYPKLNFHTSTSTPLCVNVVNGQIDKADLEKLASVTSYSGIGALSGGSLGGSVNRYSSGKDTTNRLGYSSNVVKSNSLGWLGGGWGNSNGYSHYYKPSSTVFSGQIGGSGSQSYADAYLNGVETSSRANSFSGFGTAYGSSVYPQEPIYSKRQCTDFGDNFELPEDYSYPGQPADAVSLTLAYKNLFPHTAVYNKKWFVPEDKLAFGHRTVPIEWKPSKKPSDIPEERLQLLDKPIVELKPIAPIPVNLGVYDEREEAKLAELEVIERERINQEETASQPGNFITYGDLGYAPIEGLTVPGKLTRPGTSYVNSGIGLVDAEDISEGCGPVGPPLPGYVPGTIMVNQEVVETEVENEEDSRKNDKVYVRYYLDDVSDEEDDDTVSGIFAKLRNTAQKYGPVTCPR